MGLTGRLWGEQTLVGVQMIYNFFLKHLGGMCSGLRPEKITQRKSKRCCLQEVLKEGFK